MDLFYGRADTGTLERAGDGWLDGATAVVLRVQPRGIAPGGISRAAAFGRVWLIVRHDGACRVTLTPVIDGAVRDDLEETHDFETIDPVTDEVVQLYLSEPVTWPGDATAFSRHALRGVYGTVRAALVAQESVTIDPAGDDNALTFLATALTGDLITVTYVDPALPSQALSIGVVANAITVNLATDGASAITSTAAEIKAAVDASGPASALVSVTIRDDDGGEGTGAGIVTAMPETTLTAGALYGLGGFELDARPVGVGGTSIPI